MAFHKPYVGTGRKLVLAFDIGTTFSGISYRYVHCPRVWVSFKHSCSILDLGRIQVVKGIIRYRLNRLLRSSDEEENQCVNRLFCEDSLRTNSSMVLPKYQRSSFMIEKAKFVQWVQKRRTKEYFMLLKMGSGSKLNGSFILRFIGLSDLLCLLRFKLHLRSKFGEGHDISSKIPPLPPNKTIVQVFADFLSYLLKSASCYIQDTQVNGPHLWSTVKNDIHYVLSHPNGWEGKEQNQLRRAAVLAGLIPDTLTGHSRVEFVTEGEASLHFVIQNGFLADAMAVCISPFLHTKDTHIFSL